MSAFVSKISVSGILELAAVNLQVFNVVESIFALAMFRVRMKDKVGYDGVLC
jgi:hypothetical protein